MSLFWTFLSAAGGPKVRTFVVGALAVRQVISGRRRDALLTVASAGGTGLAGAALKRIVGRRRPRHSVPIGDGTSFPSGHAAGTLALSASIVWWLREDMGLRGLPLYTIAVLSLALVLFIGDSRIALRKHHPGDVLGGYVLGGLCWISTFAALRRWALLNDVGTTHYGRQAQQGS